MCNIEYKIDIWKNIYKKWIGSLMINNINTLYMNKTKQLKDILEAV